MFYQSQMSDMSKTTNCRKTKERTKKKQTNKNISHPEICTQQMYHMCIISSKFWIKCEWQRECQRHVHFVSENTKKKKEKIVEKTWNLVLTQWYQMNGKQFKSSCIQTPMVQTWRGIRETTHTLNAESLGGSIFQHSPFQCASSFSFYVWVIAVASNSTLQLTVQF